MPNMSQVNHPRSKLRTTVLRALLFGLLVASAACTSWRGTAAPRIAPESFEARVIRVTRTDGTVTRLYQPRVIGDSVTGWARDPRRDTGGESISIALSDVRRVDRRKADALKTAGVAVGAGAGLYVLRFALLAAGMAIAGGG